MLEVVGVVEDDEIVGVFEFECEVLIFFEVFVVDLFE